VQENVEAQAAAGYMQIVLQEGQVPGAGNGQKLGNTLNYAEQESDEGRHNWEMYHGEYQPAIESSELAVQEKCFRWIGRQGVSFIKDYENPQNTKIISGLFGPGQLRLF
jgi:hypothetical protein